MSTPKIIILGAGNRGSVYGRYLKQHPDRGEVVAVAEPRAPCRARMTAMHTIPNDAAFDDWRKVADKPKFADAVIICTQDQMHAEPAVAMANLGYHILLEKPMAPTPEACKAIVRAVKDNGVMFSVCHVLRYTRYTQRLKAIVDSGGIGELVNIQRLEPVGHWHYAHSYARGNWRNTAQSGPMLLTKSCHDLDWIRYLMGTSCEAVTSFGTLKHFRKEERPQGAADHCLDCAIEPTCPYSAPRLYLEAAKQRPQSWPVSTIVPEVTPENVYEALRSGPYGRCVYACDNDVVDHQIVNLQFAGGRTASFTMMAFTRIRDRETRLFGTRGELTGDGRYIRHFDFLSEKTTTIDVEAESPTPTSGHGGGDYWLMQHFTQALLDKDPRSILSGPDETLESHLIVFAAEQARLENRVVTL